jgi:hypothetical protein
MGFLEEVGGDGEVDGGRGRIHVPEERRELQQPIAWIDASAVPAQQRPDGKGVPQIVYARGRGPGREGEREVGEEVVKTSD